jgi:nitrous oxide reductase accessory protein NosL
MSKKFKIALVGILFVSLFTELNAAMFQTVPASKATLLQQGDQKQFCVVCGMNLVMFYKTSYVATVNGKEKQYCSLHCLVDDMKNNRNILTGIKVVDTNSLKLIDAKKAYYVVGSKKKGTMSMVSKYAFSTLDAASKFAAKFGGVVTDFNAAVQASQNDFIK